LKGHKFTNKNVIMHGKWLAGWHKHNFSTTESVLRRKAGKSV